MDEQVMTRAGKRLLRWYEKNKRDLPWRQQQDPYAIWVSEIMLQQTRVETVIPYYDRFLARFPSVEELAAANLEEVLGHWSGLGYYRRARLLHRAARQIVEANQGFPNDLISLRALPGVGSYTAAAVGSIAFGIAEPAIDGNIERVVGRYLGIEDDPRRGEARAKIGQAAQDLLSPDRPGDSNQSLMEIGATICRPRNPKCMDCPLEPECLAARSGIPEVFAVRRGQKAQTRVQRKVAVVRDRQRVLLFRRPEESGQLAGMWELPWADQNSDTSPESSFSSRYGGRWRFGIRLGRVRHSITNRVFDVEIVQGELQTTNELAEGTEAGWFAEHELETLAVSSLVRKVLLAVAT